MHKIITYFIEIDLILIISLKVFVSSNLPKFHDTIENKTNIFIEWKFANITTTTRSVFENWRLEGRKEGVIKWDKNHKWCPERKCLLNHVERAKNFYDMAFILSTDNSTYSFIQARNVAALWSFSSCNVGGNKTPERFNDRIFGENVVVHHPPQELR